MVPNAEIDPQMDRLKRMFADQDICEESEKLFRPFMIPQEVAGDSYLSTDSDDLEKVTSQLQKEKGRPPKPIVRTTSKFAHGITLAGVADLWDNRRRYWNSSV